MDNKTLIPLIAAGVIIATAAGLVAGGVIKVDWNIFGLGLSNKALENALEKTLNVETLKSEASIVVEVKDNLSATADPKAEPETLMKIDAVISGETDQKDKTKPKGNAAADIKVEYQGMSLKLGGKIVSTYDLIYLRLDSLPPIFDLGGIKGQWFKIDPKALAEQMAQESGQPLSSQQLNMQQYQQMAEELKSIIKGKNLFAVKRKIGSEKIKNQSATGYLVNLNKEAVKKVLPELLQMTSKYMDETEKAKFDTEFEAIAKELPDGIDKIWDKTGGLSFEVWISDGYVVQLKYEGTLDLSKFADTPVEAQQGLLNLSLKVIYYDFNKPVTVEEPKDAKPFEEMLGGSLLEPLGGSDDSSLSDDSGTSGSGGTFTTAQKRAKDSRIKSALSQMRVIMAYNYGNDGNYDGLKCTNGDAKTLCADVVNSGSKVYFAKKPAVNSTAACIWAKLNSPSSEGKTTWYCADSSGVSGTTITNPGTTAYCVQGKSAKCPAFIEY